MTGKEYLGQIEKLDLMIENKLREIDLLRNLAQSVTAQLNPDKVQASSSQQKMAEAVERYIDLENEINDCIDNLFDLKREVISKIEQLEAKEYNILHLHYIQYLTLIDIANKYDKSYSWASDLHNRAIKHFEDKFLSENCEKL